MKQEIEVFTNEELELQVRAIKNEDGSISINAEDVAIGLGWTQKKNGKLYVKWERLNGYCKDFNFSPEVGKDDYIPESLFYRLSMKANNEFALKFQGWLADDVIPSVRKHGAYMTTDTLEQAIGNPDFMIGLLEALKDERAEKERLQAKVEEQEPLVKFAEIISNTSDNIDMNEMAKVCNNEGLYIDGKTIGRNKLFKWLKDKKIIMENNQPYQKYIDNGMFSVSEVTKHTAYGDKVFCKTFVTGKGQIKIVEMIREENKNKD